MSTYLPSFHFEANCGESAYRALARHLIEEIGRGRLRAGTRLPGTRTLAKQLGLSRNTVLYAYDELLAQGWLESRQASGTFVADRVPEPVRAKRVLDRPKQVHDSLGFPMPSMPGLPAPSALEQSGSGALSGGMPDNRLIPVDLLARAYRRVLKRKGNACNITRNRN